MYYREIHWVYLHIKTTRGVEFRHSTRYFKKNVCICNGLSLYLRNMQEMYDKKRPLRSLLPMTGSPLKKSISYFI